VLDVHPKGFDDSCFEDAMMIVYEVCYIKSPKSIVERETKCFDAMLKNC